MATQILQWLVLLRDRMTDFDAKDFGHIAGNLTFKVEEKLELT